MTTETPTTTTTNDTTAATAAAVEDTALATAATTEETTAQGEVKPDAAAADAGKTADATTDVAPDTYDTAAWTMPEGVEFDTEGFVALEPVLRELNLSQDKAGKLIGAYADKIVPMIQQRTIEQFDNNAAELKANLARDLMADPEIGGKKFEETKAMAAKAIAYSIPDAKQRSEFSEFMNESGLGNHPLLARIISGYGRALSEATTMAATTAPAEVPMAQKFYGKKG